MFTGKSAVLSKASFGVTIAFVAAAMLQAASAPAGDTVYYYSSDTVHSEVVVTDQNRNVVERTYYAPYGQVLNRDLRDGPGYTGHEEDPETGLVYMQQRYYCPECGRFLSVDPVDVDPTSGGNFDRYEYAKDNPYTNIDPDGRETGRTLQAEWRLMGAKPNYTPDTAGKVIGGAALALVAAPVAIEAGLAALSNPGTATTIVNTVADAVAGNAIGGTSLSIGGGAVAAGAHALADDALVARGGSAVGANSVEGLAKGIGTHPSGVTGFSAESANGATLSDLGKNIPHGQMGTTTAGEIRGAGGDVVPTGGRSPNHATVTGLSPETAHGLLTPTVPNPVPKPDRNF